MLLQGGSRKSVICDENSMSCTDRIPKRHHQFLTWLPNTPIEVAVDTSEGPNHTEATFGGISKTND